MIKAFLVWFWSRKRDRLRVFIGAICGMWVGWSATATLWPWTAVYLASWVLLLKSTGYIAFKEHCRKLDLAYSVNPVFS